MSYPASFALVIALSCLAFVFGSYATHVVYMLAIFITIAIGARRLGQRLEASVPMQCALAIFSSFNPWTYTKLVSGHTSMLLAYGATFWLVAELFARNPSVRVLVVAALLAAPQIQFLVCDFFLFAFLAFRLRDPRPLLAIGAAALPVAVGLITSGKSLLGIPLTVEWEVSQSLYPLQGVFLRGYFTGYDERLDPYLIWTLLPIVALATIGALRVVVRDHRFVWVVAVTTFLLLVTFGSRGPLRIPFEFAINHFAVVGLFRELYDLTGFVAIGYCILLCRSEKAASYLPYVACLATLALPVVWLSYPPGRYWIDAHSLPPPVVTAAPRSRIAFVPAVGPMRFGGQGSGRDPDAGELARGITSINEPSPQFPISSALGDLLAHDSVVQVARLGVTEIVARPWLDTDVAGLIGQLALSPNEQVFNRVRSSRPVPNSLPALTLSSPPAIGTLDAEQGSGNVYFADAARATDDPQFSSPWIRFGYPDPVRAPARFVHASEGWVDARLAFLEQPELGQAFGGALTTREDAPLALKGGLDTLVWIRGTLTAQDGKVLASDTHGYRWISLAPAVRAVRCSGECVVAAQGHIPVNLPLEPPSKSYTAVAFTELTPWLLWADVASGNPRLLRYDVRYDEAWSAFARGSIVPHVRVDTTVNGWLLPPFDQTVRVTILERGALFVALAEVLAATTELWLLVSVFMPRGRA